MMTQLDPLARYSRLIREFLVVRFRQLVQTIRLDRSQRILYILSILSDRLVLSIR